MQQHLGAFGTPLVLRVQVWQRAQVEIVGGEAFGRLGTRALDLDVSHVRLDSDNDLLRDLVLQGKDVAQLALVAIGPDVRVGPDIDELGL